MPEQADARPGNHRNTIAKKRHRRKERRKAKINPEVAPKYRKYDGWIT